MQQHKRITPSESEIAVAVLRDVSAEDRLIASLYFFEQLTVSEINQVLGMEASSIHKCLNNVFAALIPDEQDEAEEQENAVIPGQFSR